MKLLRLAIEHQNWTLAAHTIVLAAATALKRNGDSPDVTTKKEKGSPQGQPKS